jgi:glyoxylase-like metal-dependent hydrolase (beta-lactamase superfamily II)
MTMEKQVAIDKSALADIDFEEGVHEIAPDLGYQRLAIVNVMYFGIPGSREWVLIDTGVPGSGPTIRRAAAHRFGEDVKPVAIIMTHGHTDHAGSLINVAQKWNVPVYAHVLEHPYLDGRSPYPPPDPSVSSGMMAKTSPMLGRGPVDASQWLHVLPEDGSVPGMRGWKWIHTPGHTPGHISLWRESERTLIAGDAFITTNQESAYAVMTQRAEIHGPPMYFTTDWDSAKVSVQQLANLQPEVVVTGHGRAMRGPQMRAALDTLARGFDMIAVPRKGRYVNEPARANEDGPTYVPPEI